MRTFKFFTVLALIVGIFLFPNSIGGQRSIRVNPTPKPTPTATVVQVNSFSLFWPISAGKVMGEPLYFLKSFKEDLRELLIFSDLKKAEYNVTLSEKRVVEAEKLLVLKKDSVNGEKSLDVAQAKREKAFELIKKTEEKGRYIEDLKNRMTESLENQRALLHYVATQISEDQKGLINENVDALNATLSKLL